VVRVFLHHANLISMSSSDAILLSFSQRSSSLLAGTKLMRSMQKLNDEEIMTKVFHNMITSAHFKVNSIYPLPRMQDHASGQRGKEENLLP
jgi:hypothetical protein